MRAVVDIRAAGFAAPAQADLLRFSRPDRRLTVRGAGGTTRLALVFDSAAGGIWTRADSGGKVWRMEAWEADQLTPAESTLASRSKAKGTSEQTRRGR